MHLQPKTIPLLQVYYLRVHELTNYNYRRQEQVLQKLKYLIWKGFEPSGQVATFSSIAVKSTC
jgi:hypothetical protein